jgi:hypothetical protein
MNSERYYSVVVEMEDLIKKHPGGCADKEALAKMEFLVNEIKYGAGSDPYINDKAGSMNHLASILYSVRKHQKWRANGEAGSLVIRGQIRSAISALRTWPQTRANMERFQKEG